MNIGAIGSFGSYTYTPYIPGITDPRMTTAAATTATGAVGAPTKAEETEVKKPILNPGASTEVQPGKKSSPAECKTCQNRKYQDGSDESDVSFQAPTHVSPQASTSATMAHEQQHVANAYEKASKGNGKVLQASVSLKMSVCPECGRVYCAGGETTTRISYPNDKFSQNRKSAESQAFRGANFDAAV